MTGSTPTATQCLSLEAAATPSLDATAVEAVSRPSSAKTIPISAAHQVWFVTILLVADLVVMTTACLAVARLPASQNWATIAALLGATGCVQGTGYAIGLYDTRSADRMQRGCTALAGLGLLAALLAILFIYGTHGTAAPTRIVLAGIGAILVLALLRVCLAAWIERHAGSLAERLVLVGTATAVSCLMRPASAPGIGDRVVGWIAVDDARDAPIEPLTAFDPQSGDVAAVLSDAWRIGDALRACRSKIDRVVIALGTFDEAVVTAMLKRLEYLPFEVALAPPGNSLDETDDVLSRTSCLILRRPAITQWELVGKRAFDVMAASILLMLLSPLMLLIAVLIRHGSPGPALFRQTRWGLNNAPFTVFKFRTMWYDTAADGSLQAMRGDKRITPIGAFLRRSSLDELPQLLNVLNGSMSLVGPRPHPVELNRHYLGVIDHYAGRHRIMPGITGLAQVRGFRGETSSPSAMQRRIELDLEYIRTRSLGTDLWILIKTVISVLRGDNAY